MDIDWTEFDSLVSAPAAGSSNGAGSEPTTAAARPDDRAPCPTFVNLAAKRQWVAWQTEDRPGGKPTKVPYSPYGQKAEANNPGTWGTRAQAEARAALLPKPYGYGGVGLELGDLGDGRAIGGVDLDSCRDPRGTLEPWAQGVIERFGSYAEVSPSSTGVKIFFLYAAAELPQIQAVMGKKTGKKWSESAGGDHPPAIEIYLTGRYFAVTDDPVPGGPDDLCIVSIETILWLISEGGPTTFRAPGSAADPPGKSLDGSRSAVAFRKALKLRRDGVNFEAMVSALRANPETAAWCLEKGAANGQRELLRLWERTAPPPNAAEEFGLVLVPPAAGPGGAGPPTSGTSSEGALPDPAVVKPTRAVKPRHLSIGSDAEIADHLVKELVGLVGQIVHDEGAFWCYRQSRWEAIPDDLLWRSLFFYDGAKFLTPGGQDAVVTLGKGRIQSILACMAPLVIRRNFFADAAMGINCSSGFITFATDGTPSLVPHSPDQRQRHVITASWSQSHNEETMKASLLFRLFDGCFRDDTDKREKVALLGEVAGIAALGHATRMIEPKALVCFGRHAENGKSQVLTALRSLLPKNAVSAIAPGKFDDRTFACHLAGKLLNAPDELGGTEAIASEVFKQIITGDPLTVRDVYSQAFEFVPRAQHVYATNNLPPFKGGMDRGVRRRLMVLTFNRVIPREERLDRIGRRIGEEEADLLLGWAVRGAARVIAAQSFTTPPSSAAALLEWMYSSDPVLAWLECDEVEYPNNGKIPETMVSMAHANFVRWASNESFTRDRLPAVNGFSQRVEAAGKGITKKRTSAGARFIGLGCTGQGSEGSIIP